MWLLDEGSINFLTGVATISFGVFGFSGAIEVLKVASQVPEERRYLVSIALYSLLLIVCSLLPLALHDRDAKLPVALLSNGCLAILSTALFVFSVYEVATRKVTIKYPFTSILLFAITLCGIGAAGMNMVAWQSLVIYKLLVLWGLFVLGVRFFLFLLNLSAVRVRDK